MAFINWGQESDKQKKYRAFIEEQALLEQAINNARNRSGNTPAVGGGSLRVDSGQQTSIIVFRELNQATYRYYVARYSSNEILGPFDTGVSVTDYGLNDLSTYPLQYSGYALRFYRGDINENTILFLDYEGMLVDSVVAISTDLTIDSFIGKYIAATDFDQQTIWIFDGKTLLTDTTVLDGVNGFELGAGEYPANDRGVSIRTNTNDGDNTIRKFYLGDSNSITQTYEHTQSPSNDEYPQPYLFYKSNNTVILIRNQNNGRVNRIEIIDALGNLISGKNIVTNIYTDSEYRIYGSGNFFLHTWRGGDTNADHEIHSWDHKTSDLYTTIVNAATYTNWQYESRQRSYGSDYDYPNMENAIAWFYGEGSTTDNIFYSDDILAVRFFDGQEPSTYTYTEGSTKGLYLDDEAISKNFILHVVDQNDNGQLQAMVMKTNGETNFVDLEAARAGLDDLDLTENVDRVAVVIEYNEAEINTIVHAFDSSGNKYPSKLELATRNHGAYNSYGVYLISGDDSTYLLTSSGTWSQYPDLGGYDAAGFYTNLNQTTSPYYINRSGSMIPYTHTQLTDDPDGGTAPGDFISDGAIANGDSHFGQGSSYFTNLYPGLFVMAAKSINIEAFKIDGELGADGDGSYETELINIPGYSKTYTACVKRVFDANDPSVNHIIIVDVPLEVINQTVPNDTNLDLQKIGGIGSATEIHYLLFAKTPDGSGYVNYADSVAVAEAYLDLVDGLSLANTLTALNANYSNITGIFPAYDSGDPDRIYYFSDLGNNDIVDGGDDMYDTGNIMSTTLSEGIDFRVFKSVGGINEFTIPGFEEAWFGKNGMFVYELDENDDIVIRNYDLKGNFKGEESTGHPDYEYNRYIEDRGQLVTSEKYYDPELSQVVVNTKFHAISPKGISQAEVILPDSPNTYRVVSNDWGTWN